MEPITTAWMMSTLIGGWLGNRGDFWLCRGTNQLYKRINENIHEPANHHIQRAIRKSYLKATLMVVRHIEAKRKWYKLSDARWSNITEVKSYVKNQIHLTDNENIDIKNSMVDESHREILFPKDGSSTDRMDELVINLKQSIIRELEGGRRKVEATLIDCIMNGWIDNNRDLDFYKLTCAFFTQELKENTELSTFIQTEYLDTIQVELGEVKVTMSSLRTSLDEFHEEYRKVLPIFHEIYNSLGEVKESLIDLPERTAALILNEIKENNINYRHITISEEYQQYITDLHTCNEELKSIISQLDGVQQALCQVDEKIRPVLQQNIVNLEKQLLHKSEEKNSLEQSFETFIQNILQLAKQFNFSQSGQHHDSERLRKARTLFEEGKYTELNVVLNETEMDREITLLKEKRETLASELSIKAQSIVVIKPDNWFEEADRLYTKAIEVSNSPEIMFDYALFLTRNNITNKAIEIYESTQHLKLSKNQRADTLNNLGILNLKIDKLNNAEELHLKALKIYEQLAESKPDLFNPKIALSFLNLGHLARSRKDYGKTEKYYNKALSIYREYAGKGIEYCLASLAGCLNSLGILYRLKSNMFNAVTLYDKAVECHSEAADIFKKLSKNKPNTYLTYITWSNSQLSKVHTDYDITQNLLEDNLNINIKLSKENPFQYLPEIVQSYKDLSQYFINTFKYQKAEETYIRAFEVLNKLVDHNPMSYKLDYANLCGRISYFYKEKNRDKIKSIKFAKLASKIFNQYDNIENSWDLEWKSNVEYILRYWNKN